MLKLAVISVFVLVLLWSNPSAQAGGPKIPLRVSTLGGSTAAVSVTLCDATTLFPCSGAGSFTCPVVNVYGPDLIVKSTCGPAGFKTGSFSYSISTPAGGCSGSQFVAFSKTATCDQTGVGGGIVVLKVGNGQ